MRRTGGIAKHGHRRKPVTDGDVYFTEEAANCIAKYLAPHVSFFPRMMVLDACANTGTLGRSFQYAIYGERPTFRYVGLDLQDIKISGKSILDEKLPHEKYEVIVANPPWKESVAKPIFFHLRNLLAENGVLFFVINNVFMYQGPERARALGCQKFYFLPRYIFKAAGRPLLDCGVTVYHKGEIPLDAARLPCYIDVPKP